MFTLGIFTGIGTAFFWAASSVIHAHISRVLGVHSLMLFRQPLATVMLFILCIFFNQFQNDGFYALSMALLSGILGIGIADWCLYASALRIGLRSALICNSLSTCITGIIGAIFLQEFLGFQGYLGIVIATIGVITVITSEQKHTRTITTPSTNNTLFGILLALTSAFLLSFAFVGSKEALNQGMPTLLLTFYRNGAASILLWCIAIPLHRIHSSCKNLKDHPELIKLFFIGCIFGPVGGIWLSAVALELTPTAVAATLIGLQPVALLLVSGIVEKRCPSKGSIIGSFVACTGAALVLWR